MPDYGISIITALVTVITTMGGTVAAVTAILRKRDQNNDKDSSSNGYAKRVEISKLHEKLNEHSATANRHCADQLAVCNEEFKKLAVNDKAVETRLDAINANLNEVKMDVKELMRRK